MKVPPEVTCIDSYRLGMMAALRVVETMRATVGTAVDPNPNDIEVATEVIRAAGRVLRHEVTMTFHQAPHSLSPKINVRDLVDKMEGGKSAVAAYRECIVERRKEAAATAQAWLENHERNGGHDGQ